MDGISRRRILQVSGTTLTIGAGFVGSAAANDRCTNGLNGDDSCDAYVIFDDQTVRSDCESGQGDAVVVNEAYLPCGGFIDIHDTTRTAVFGKGYPLGATCYLDPGTYTNVCIDLYEGNCSFGTCTTWTNVDDELPSTRDLIAMLHLDTDGDEEFLHYCQHESATSGLDHAYVCNGAPVDDRATVTAD